MNHLVGVEGFEPPTNGRIKICCLEPLDDTPENVPRDT